MNKRMLDNEDFDAIVSLLDKRHNTAFEMFKEKNNRSNIHYDNLLTMEGHSLQAFKGKYAHLDIELAMGEPIKSLPDYTVSRSLYLARSLNEKKQKIISIARKKSIPVGEIAGELAEHVSKAIFHLDEFYSDLVKRTVSTATDYVIEKTPDPPKELLPLIIIAQVYSCWAAIPGPVTLSVLTSAKDVREYRMDDQTNILSGRTSIIGDGFEIGMAYDSLKSVKNCLDKDIDSFSGRAFSTLRDKGAFLHDVEYGEPSVHKQWILFGMAVLSKMYESKIEQIEELLSVTKKNNPNQIQADAIEEDIEDDSDFSPH